MEAANQSFEIYYGLQQFNPDRAERHALLNLRTRASVKLNLRVVITICVALPSIPIGITIVGHIVSIHVRSFLIPQVIQKIVSEGTPSIVLPNFKLATRIYARPERPIKNLLAV